MRDAAQFGIKEIRRGDADPAPNKLQAERKIWLSFDGSSMTIHDALHGQMTSPSRLTMAGAQLGRVDINGVDQVITANQENKRV